MERRPAVVSTGGWKIRKMHKKTLIVVGNGMAGARFLAELVARGGAEKFNLVVFGDEPGGAYNRIMLSDVLNGSKTPACVVTHDLDWYQTNGISLYGGQKIVAIDSQNRTVTSENSAVFSYDTLVLATGSRALVPPMDGLLAPDESRKKGVFVLRTLEDCDRVANFAAKATRAVVIGGGLLGLEAARGLMEHGAQVHIVHRSNCLMTAQLDQNAGDLLKREIEMMGISVHLDKATTKILGEESVAGLEFRDQTQLRADMVVIACGITPNVEMARESGLEIQKAICVDDEMRVQNQSEIYAIGECCEHRGQVYGLVAPGWEQARVLAQILSGQNTGARYLGSKTSTKLKVLGVDVASIGTPHEREGDEVISYVEARKGRYKKLIIRENRLTGAILLGDTRRAATLMQAFDRASVLPDERAGLLFSMGKSDANADLPDDATVCNCNGVAAGTIRGAIKNGADLGQIMSETRAGTGCGTCKSVLKGMLKV